MVGIKRKQDVELAKSRISKRARTSSETPATNSTQQSTGPFIRGGSKVFTPLEKKEVQAKAERDVLFEEAAPAKQNISSGSRVAIPSLSHATPRPKSLTKNWREHSNPRASPSALQEPTPTIEGLSYRRLVRGSKVLGRVCQINRHDVAMSLPNNLTGYVPAYSISQRLKQDIAGHPNSAAAEGEALRVRSPVGTADLACYLRVGQYLRASVTSTHCFSKSHLQGKKRIGLSLLPQDANRGTSPSNLAVGSVLQAEVATVEDHGLTVTLGFEDSSTKAFLPFSEIASDDSAPWTTVGAILLCMVTDLSPEGNVIKVSTHSRRLGLAEGGSILKISSSTASLLPGTAVQFHVSAITRSGIAGKLMDLVHVSADIFHAGGSTSNEPLDRTYREGELVKGRIIFAPPPFEPVKLLVSLLEPIVSLSATLDDVSRYLSTIQSTGTIERVEPGIGVFMSLGKSTFRGFAHISRLSDTRVESLSATSGYYKVGSSHDARILGFNLMDRLFILSLEPRILRKPFISFDSIKPGHFLDGTIESLILDSSGVRALSIDIGEGIRGYVPRLHFEDSPSTRPELKFKEGKRVRARVIALDMDRRRVRLTLRGALLEESIAVLQSYDEVVVGARAPGMITNLVDAGAALQFFGNARAFLPISQFGEAHARDAKQQLKVGQIISVHVLSVDPTRERMVVSALDGLESILSKKETLHRLEPGSLVKAIVTTTTSASILLRLEDSGLPGELPLHQLADGANGNVESLAESFRSGQTIADAVILKRDFTKMQVHLTCKPSLITSFKLGTIPASFSEVRAGSVVTGLVINITPTGVFVEFADCLTALLPKSQIGDDALLLPDYGFVPFQTIESTVLGVDLARRRFVLTLRPLFNTKPSKKGSIGGLASSSGPDLESVPTAQELSLGLLTTARIVSVKRTQINVELPGGAPGRVDISSIFDTSADIKSTKNPLGIFKPKQLIQVRIAGLHDSKTHRYLPITHRRHATVFELSARQSDQRSQDFTMLTLDQVKLHSSWLCFVNNIQENCLWVNLSPNVRGCIRLLDVSADSTLLEDMPRNFPVGSALQAEVVAVDLQEARLDLSARSDSIRNLDFERLARGSVLPARITKVLSRQLLVQLSDSVSGPIQLTDLEDDFSKATTSSFRKNQIVRVCVTEVDKPNGRVSLSLRPSRTKDPSLPVMDREIISLDQLREGDIIRGFVKLVHDSGIFVALGTSVTAFVRVSDLSDSYLKDWKAIFQQGQLVQGKVNHLDADTQQARMTLKQSHVYEKYQAPLTYSDYEPGQNATGNIRKVENFGIFVVLDESANVSGLCHRSEMSDEGVEDARSLFKEGERVRVRILTIDAIKRRMTLGLKTSYFGYDAHDNVPPNDTQKSVNESKGAPLTETFDSGVLAASAAASRGPGPRDRCAEVPDTRPNDLESGVLEVEDFNWMGGALQTPVDSADLRKHRGSAPKSRTHKRLMNVDETATDEPQSEADFERVLLTRPNSSLLWIAYAAFHLRSDDIEKARSVASRAVQAINHQDTKYSQEIFDVWVAFLNLENTYGDESSVKNVFERACEYNNAQEMHEHLAKIFIRTGKMIVRISPSKRAIDCLLTDSFQEADQLFQSMIKTFSFSPGVWLNYANFLYDCMSLPHRARDLLPRALQALPTHKHIEITSKFAQLEFRSSGGEAERGRTMFEGLLGSFPKRFDLWNVFLDQEMAVGPADQVRGIFTRITSMRLKPRRAKFFFKKWLDYEEKNGEGRRIDSVKAQATAFVQGKANNAEEDS